MSLTEPNGPNRRPLDRQSAAYKKELYICSTIVIVLTVLGGSLLGYRISTAERMMAEGKWVNRPNPLTTSEFDMPVVDRPMSDEELERSNKKALQKTPKTRIVQ